MRNVFSYSYPGKRSIDPLNPDCVPSVFIFKRKAAALENSREQDSDKSKMGRYERKLRHESLVSEQKAILNL